ncbi:hypothetical protein [Streptomyces montanisoli]|uniref:Tetratricopeptide repeat protein n=1 Tax=Streptomyces montanisoli TaxID=2798581 RepID=A0A940RZJ3_9ACTN|nr:hypothetical protein [Streptomyces montanisoli]MBP0459849.1 hypothetical protein [Streptomyces montanisoli]
MSRVILVILIGICIYFWFRSRRGADRMIKTMTGPEVAASQDAAVPSERSAELGLLPAQKQDTRYAAAPGPEAARALAAAEAGDWEPAAELLATAAANKDWERRALWAELLGKAAADRTTPDGTAPAWLAEWEKGREGDGDAALVRAGAEGPGAARTAALERAKEADPADPTPYVVEIGGAVAAEVPHSELSALFREAIIREPYLYAAHAAALRYWLPKGKGSAPLAEEFATDAAAGAPLGSLMTAFPLIAWFEEHLESTRDPEEYRTAELTGRIDRALMDAAAAPADHPRLPELRHLLAYFLYKQDRFDAALEQFRHVDGYVNALPWSYYTQQNLYMRARETTVRNAA